MVKLSPTVSYIATLTPNSDYTVTLPDVRLNLEASKAILSEKNITGSASISIWAANIAGERRDFFISLPEEIYIKLRRMKNCGAEEWILQAQGRLFAVVLDVTSAIQDTSFSGRWNCNLAIVFIEEITA